MHEIDEQSHRLPPRPRRRLVTPWTLGLAAVLVAALGFLGGVQVQKSRTDSGTATAFVPPGGAGQGQAGPGGQSQGRPGAGGQGQAQGGNGGSTPVVGEVKSVGDGALYVTATDGTTVKVKTNAKPEVVRTADARVRAIHPGDTVIVTGKTGSGGAVTASRITATASGVSAGGLGGMAPFGAAPGGGNAPGG